MKLVFLIAVLCLLLPACKSGEARSVDVLTYQGTLKAIDVDGWDYYNRGYLVTLNLDDTLVIFHTDKGGTIEGLVLGQRYEIDVEDGEGLYLRSIQLIGEGT